MPWSAAKVLNSLQPHASPELCGQLDPIGEAVDCYTLRRKCPAVYLHKNRPIWNHGRLAGVHICALW